MEHTNGLLITAAGGNERFVKISLLRIANFLRAEKRLMVNGGTGLPGHHVQFPVEVVNRLGIDSVTIRCREMVDLIVL